MLPVLVESQQAFGVSRQPFVAWSSREAPQYVIPCMSYSGQPRWLILDFLGAKVVREYSHFLTICSTLLVLTLFI